MRVASFRLARILFASLLFLGPLPALTAQQSAAPEAPAAPAAPAAPQGEESLVLPEEAESPAAAAPAGPLVSTWDFLRMLLILAAVVGVIYLLFYLLKRGFRRQLPQNELIRILGSRSLSGNRALHLVSLGRGIYLVGAAEGGITLIAEVKDQETLDQIRLESSQAGPPQGFAQFFQSLWKGGRQNLSGDSLELLKQQRQRLRKM